MQKYHQLYENSISQLYNDQEYIEQLVQKFYINSFNQISVIKNSEGVYLAATSKFANLIKLTPQQIIGRRVLPEINKAYKFCAKDNPNLPTNFVKRYINVLNLNGQNEIYIFNHLLITNPTTTNVVGTHFFAEKFCPISIFDVMLNMHGCTSKDNAQHHLKFTKRESEILFCISIGLTSRKSIANFLSTIYKTDINPNTIVKDTLKALYAKISCGNSIHGLMEFTRRNQQISQIPPHLIRPACFSVE